MPPTRRSPALAYDEKRDLAAREAGLVKELANCTFRALYFQRDEATDEACYYMRVDFPSDRPSVKGTFAGAALAAGPSSRSVDRRGKGTPVAG